MMDNTIATEATNQVSAPDPKSHRDALGHAWSWVSVHAAQRQQSLYFFLIGASFLTQAYVSSEGNHRSVLALGIAVLGLLVTGSFCAMQERSSAYVLAGEQAMLRAEIVLEHQTQTKAFNILRNTKVAQGQDAQRWPARLVYGSAALGFFAAVASSLHSIVDGARLN